MRDASVLAITVHLENGDQVVAKHARGRIFPQGRHARLLESAMLIRGAAFVDGICLDQHATRPAELVAAVAVQLPAAGLVAARTLGLARASLATGETAASSLAPEVVRHLAPTAEHVTGAVTATACQAMLELTVPKCALEVLPHPAMVTVSARSQLLHAPASRTLPMVFSQA